jgi:acyl-CoA reductase-like NAD-dependent aldehyde dehydrogenase
MIREMNPIQLHVPLDYIDNQTFTPLVRLPASISNPNTHEPLQQQRATSEAYLEQALEAAQRAHRDGLWRQTEVETRVGTLEKIADALEARTEELAAVESLTTGVTIRQTRALARLVPLAFRQAAKQIQSALRPLKLSDRVGVQRQPWGPAAIITPWNATACFTAQKVASALAAGCPVILKPSEWAPHSAGILAEIIAQLGLPQGTFQLVHGGPEVASRLVADQRIKAVSYTGSQAGGRAIAQLCAADLKPMQLELGGVNALIVLEDADLNAAAEGVVTALTALNGQWCRGLGRLLVQRSCYHALLRRVLERLESLHIGDSLLPESDMGPLVHQGHLHRVLEQRDQLLACGGVVHSAARLPDLPGYFVEPALITNCSPRQTQEEIFGPVAAVHMFRDDAEAAALANQPQSALIHYIFSANEDRARRLAAALESGTISINGVSLFGLHPQAPRTSWGLSGIGESGINESLRFFTGAQAVGLAGS